MARTITVLHTRGCPNVALIRQRLGDALTRLAGPAPMIVGFFTAWPTNARLIRKGIKDAM